MSRRVMCIRQTTHCENQEQYECFMAGVDSVSDVFKYHMAFYHAEKKLAYVYYHDLPGKLAKGQIRGSLTLPN